eukprot:COSAG01_NODE_51845_length_351_cov_1.154762_1_plen_24_part_01
MIMLPGFLPAASEHPNNVVLLLCG